MKSYGRHDDHTAVWVRTDAIEAIREPSTPPRTKNGRKRRLIPAHEKQLQRRQHSLDWGWVFGYIMSTGPSSPSPSARHNSKIRLKNNSMQKAAVTIRISDESSPYHNESFNLFSNGFVMANPHDVDESNSNPPNDLINLTHLHEPAVISSLSKRYARDEIYTATGPILLALNPFKRCPHLYSQKIMDIYSSTNSETSFSNTTSNNPSTSQNDDINEDDCNLPPPHVFAIADRSFRNMMENNNKNQQRNQSILVSGESGAGKTMTTKFIMQYLASLSQKSQTTQKIEDSPKKQNKSFAKKKLGKNKKSEEEKGGIEQQVLQSNPILESFGNARTIRNDNSSRFGKFIEIRFQQQDQYQLPTLIGASIRTYLLEKVRLITQSPGERNYHVFYEVLDGSTEEERELLYLYDLTAEDFNLTNSSGTYDRRDNVTDSSTFKELKEAMNTMGFSKREQFDALSIVCALLHASNITFIEMDSEASQLDDSNPFVGAAVTLLGVSAENLNTALCTCAIEVAGERLMKNLSLQQASKALEAFIKATYAALFRYIVRAVNYSIGSNVDDNGRHNKYNANNTAFIGVLDIFGFESFKRNSFEQLCINYCNEALQQQFNRFIFKLEQKEYEREGIKWSFITFPDNQDVLDLIEKKHTGILSILDEQCRLAKCTDQSFANAVYEKCSTHDRFDFTPTQKVSGMFNIHHYAGPVEYTTSSFLEKNKDELPKEATELLHSSSNPFLGVLANLLTNTSDSRTSTRNINISSDSSVCSVSSSSSRNGNRKSSSLSRASVGSQFTTQLRDLRDIIDHTSPHYIRCLKPNDDLVPDHFDYEIIADQLRCAGVLEAVRVSRVGYPQRYTYSLFVQRYRILALKELKRIPSYQKSTSCEVLVNAVAMQLREEMTFEQSENLTSNGRTNSSTKKIGGSSSELIAVGIQIGRTKVFLQQQAFDALEKLRNYKVDISATKIQAIVRMHHAAATFQLMHYSIIRIQCCIRRYNAMKCVYNIRIMYSAVVLQSFWRRIEAQCYFEATSEIVRWVQKFYRGKVGRRKYRCLDMERKVIKIQSFYRQQYDFQRFQKLRCSAVQIQCWIRRYQALNILIALRKDAKNLNKVAQERDRLKQEAIEMKKLLEEARNKAEKELQIRTEQAQREFKELRQKNQIQKESRMIEEADAARNKATRSDDQKSTILALTTEVERLKKELANASTQSTIYNNFPSTPNTQEKELLRFAKLCEEKDREIVALKQEIKSLHDNYRPQADNPDARDIEFSKKDEQKRFMKRIFSFRQSDSVESLKNTKQEDSIQPDKESEDSTAGSLVSSIFTPQKMLSQLAPLNALLRTNPVDKEKNIRLNDLGSDGNNSSNHSNSQEIDNKDNDSTIDVFERKSVCPSVLSSSFVDEQGNGTLLHEAIHSLDQVELAHAIETSDDIHKDINTGDSEGRTPLHLAALHSSQKMVSSLLENFAVTNSQDHSGNTPLHYAEEINTMKVLLNGGARPNIPNENGLCALHLAVRRRDLMAVKLLIDNGADVNAADNIRWYTPLHLIAQSETELTDEENTFAKSLSTDSEIRSSSIVYEIADYMCSANSLSKPDLNSQDRDGNTPLHHSSILGEFDAKDLIKVFLKNGSNPNICNRRGQTPLHLYCHNILLRKFQFYQELLHLFLFSGGDPNIISQGGCTPLHLALFHRDIDGAVQLVYHGAQLHVLWTKPSHWKSFWDLNGSAETLALDMVLDEHSVYRILSSIRQQQKWAPSRPACMHCKAMFGTFVRQHHCRHCGRIICGQCSQKNVDPNSFPSSFHTLEKGFLRVCVMCEEILRSKQDKESDFYRPSFATQSTYISAEPLSGEINGSSLKKSMKT